MYSSYDAAIEIIDSFDNIVDRMEAVSLSEHANALRYYIMERGFCAIEATYRKSTKAEIKYPAAERAAERAALTERVRSVITLDILNTWRLSSGLLLGQATRADLLKEAEWENSIALGHVLNQNFYRAIAKRLTDDTVTVSGILTATDADEIKELIYTARRKAA